LELVNQSKKDPRKLPKSFASVPQLATSKMSADRTYNNFMFEEKQRKPSAFVKDSSFNSHYPSRKMSGKFHSLQYFHERLFLYKT